jgi:6-hydroxytryprostatin B O-methyltransferase
VGFVEHDFFLPQPTTADAYFLRRILHDWSDEDARQILGNLRPVLRTGARLMVMDTILTEPGSIPLYLEKCTRSLDIGMFTLLAGKERTLEQFVHLVESVEPKLKFESCKTPDGSILSLMTWIYQE